MQDDTVRTSRPSMRRALFIALGAACLLALGGGLFAKTRYESSIREQIERALTALPEPVKASAGSIDVSFFERSATLKNITGTVDSATGPQPFSIKSVAISGLNRDAFRQDAGAATWAEKMEILNADFAGSFVRGSVASYVLKGISGNFPLLMTESVASLPVLLSLEKAEPLSDDDARALLGSTARLLRAYETVHVKNAEMTDYAYSATVDGNTVAMTIGHMETADYSVRGVGRTTLRGVTMAMGDAFAATFDTLSLERGTFPSFVPFLEEAASGTSSPLLLPLLWNQPFALINLRAAKVAVTDPAGQTGPNVTLADALFSVASESAKDKTLDLSFTGLSMKKSLAAESADLPESVLPLLPEPVLLDGALATALTVGEHGRVDFLLKQARLKGPALGEFDLNFDVRNVNAMSLFMGMPGIAALASLNLALTDAGMTEILFTAQADATGTSAGEERAKAVAQLNAPEGQVSGGSVQKVLAEAIAAFLNKPGGQLRISLRPQTPLTSESLRSVQDLDPKSIGLTVSATPGK